MPILSRFKGITVRMFFNDTQQHYKPHVHVEYSGNKAVIGLDGELLEGALPRRQYNLILGWLALHEEEIYKAWYQAIKNEQFDKIDP